MPHYDILGPQARPYVPHCGVFESVPLGLSNLVRLFRFFEELFSNCYHRKDSVSAIHGPGGNAVPNLKFTVVINVSKRHGVIRSRVLADHSLGGSGSREARASVLPSSLYLYVQLQLL